MSELPEGWAKSPVGDLVNVIRGVTFPASSKVHEASEGVVACLRTSHIQQKLLWDNIYFIPKQYVRREEQLTRRNDILMSMANSASLVGKVCINETDEAACFGAFLAAIRCNEVDYKYVYYFLRSSDAQSSLRSTASQTVNIANISVAELEKLKVPLPPLAEQKRIAQKLDALLAQVDTLKARIDAIPALLKRFRQCVLQAASTGDLTASWATKEGASKWINLRFRELLKDFRGGASIRPSGETHGTPVLRSSAVRPMLVNFEDVSHFDKSMTLNPNDYAMEGDLLFTRLSGSAEFVGVCGRVKATPRVPTQFPDRLFCARLINSRYAPYLEIFFSSQNYISYIGRNLKSSAGHQRITTETVKNAEIRLPSLEEQIEIVRRVEQLFAYADQLEAKVAAAQQRIDALTQSLLAKAFRGELVPQDPTDEPASVLLERIRTQRAATPKPKRGRKAATS
ncbi:restriction endonuclease subunit S [Xanthomonas oryzae]|uniref:restriction endonuclease subunit S n=1 Tax=Xanthomonas oryzae TaxID=347 RepID=UPI0015EF3999|nr:restriction endonuclease subunit S [Xanthomonas oryzae]